MLRARGRLLIGLFLASAAPLRAQAPAAPPQYFEEAVRWSFRLGTDATFSFSNLPRDSTNETNDRATNFDTLWLRLYAKLAYGDKAELVADFFSSDARTPTVFGLYGRVELHKAFGVRVGMLPLVVGGWQDRAYPHRQPLINQPLFSQYILVVRNDSVPAGADELLAQRGRRAGSRFSLGFAGEGSANAIYYEHCWSTGIEVFGQLGRLRYRAAVMEGPPGSSFRDVRDEKSGNSWEGRLTYRLGGGFRVGASGARGPYLQQRLQPFLPAGRRARGYRQTLAGADVRWQRGRVEAHGEWVWNRYDSPYVAGPLQTQGYYGELAVTLAPGLQVAGRYSALDHSEVADSAGHRADWDFAARRLEAGAVYRFFEDHAGVKAVFQRTSILASPLRREDVAAAQLVLSY